MALKRKQQKLLGFGTRWQTPDPTLAVVREQEVRHALDSLRELYRQQIRTQDGGATECVAVFDVRRRQATLVKRRGQVIQSFGHRTAGEWVLHPEEVLYLAERSTLSVYVPCATGGDSMPADCCGVEISDALSTGPETSRSGLRRLGVADLYSLLLGVDLAFAEYLVFAHLRRAGHFVERRRSRSETVALPGAGDAEDQGEDEPSLPNSPAAKWLMVQSEEPARQPHAATEGCLVIRRLEGRSEERLVHIVRPDDPVMQLFERLGGGERLSIEELLASQPIFAVADDTSGTSPAFIELGVPRRPNTTCAKSKELARAHQPGQGAKEPAGPPQPGEGTEPSAKEPARPPQPGEGAEPGTEPGAALPPGSSGEVQTEAAGAAGAAAPTSDMSKEYAALRSGFASLVRPPPARVKRKKPRGAGDEEDWLLL